MHGLLTALFAAAALDAPRCVLRSRDRRDRVDHRLHTDMASVMAVMPWSWGRALTDLPRSAFFTAAALWFPLTGLHHQDHRARATGNQGRYGARSRSPGGCPTRPAWPRWPG